MRHLILSLCLFFLAGCESLSLATRKQPDTSFKPAVNMEQDLRHQAQSQQTKGEYKKAAASYEQLLKKSPGNRNDLFAYAESLRLAKKSNEAIAAYDQLIELEEGSIRGREGKALALIELGKLGLAQSLLQDVVARDASKWRALNALGVVYALQGKNQEAQDYFRMASEVSHDDPLVMNNIALSMGLSGRVGHAEILIKQAISKTPKSDTNYTRFQHNLALIYGLGGKEEQAKTVLLPYLSEAAIQNNLGFYAALRGDEERAKSFLQQAVSGSAVHYRRAWENLEALDNRSIQ